MLSPDSASLKPCALRPIGAPGGHVLHQLALRFLHDGNLSMVPRVFVLQLSVQIPGKAQGLGFRLRTSQVSSSVAGYPYMEAFSKP